MLTESKNNKLLVIMPLLVEFTDTETIYRKNIIYFHLIKQSIKLVAKKLKQKIFNIFFLYKKVPIT